MADFEQANTGWEYTGIYGPDKSPFFKVFYAVKAKLFQTYWL